MKRRVIIRKNKPRSRASEEAFPWRRLFIIAAFLGAALFFVGLAWLWRTGWFRTTAENIAHESLILTQGAGFAVNDILVEGRSNTEREQIIGTLGVEKGSPILAFSPQDALKRLMDIPWVKNGTVERRLPDTIFVKLTERKPIALWQLNKSYRLIDGEGQVLRELNAKETPPLPLVVGEGANLAASDLLGQLLNYPAILDVFKAAVRVSSRRWDLHLSHDVVAKLPEENLAVALRNLNSSITEQHILERNILGIDLRLEGRMIVETTEDIAKEKKPKAEP